MTKVTTEPILVFMHIGKTGGSTLHGIIDRQYKQNEVFTIDTMTFEKSIEEFKKFSDQRKNEIKALKGHFVKRLWNELQHRPVKCITILREPIDRVISIYYYILQDKGHYLYHKVVSNRMDLKDFACSDIWPDLDNHQTRMLAEMTGTQSAKDPAKMLEEAKKNLNEYFSIVGITQHFDESVMLMRRLFRWKLPFYVRRNVVKNRPFKKNIPKEILSIIEKRNMLDLELYKYAEDRLESLIKQQGLSFKIEIEIFKLLNVLCGYIVFIFKKSERLNKPQIK